MHLIGNQTLAKSRDLACWTLDSRPELHYMRKGHRIRRKILDDRKSAPKRSQLKQVSLASGSVAQIMYFFP